MKLHPVPVVVGAFYVLGGILLAFRDLVWLGILLLAATWLIAIRLCKLYDPPRRATT